MRYEYAFWDGQVNELTHKIEVGVEKGIYTTYTIKAVYTHLYEETSYVREYPGDTVLYFTPNTWLYLEDSKISAAYSAWTSGQDEHATGRMLEYYRINPDKLPDIAYCMAEDYIEGYPMYEMFEKLGYRAEQQGDGVILTK